MGENAFDSVDFGSVFSCCKTKSNNHLQIIESKSNQNFQASSTPQIRRKLLKPPDGMMKAHSMEYLRPEEEEFEIPNHTPISFGHNDYAHVEKLTVKGPRKRQIEEVLQARKDIQKKAATKP